MSRKGRQRLQTDVRELVARIRETKAQLDLVTEMLDTAFDIYPDLHNAPAMLAAFRGRDTEHEGEEHG
jgi:hypothetical protein